MKDRVVITGAGLVSSLGLSASETWDALLAGKCGIKPIEDFDAGGFMCRYAAQVQNLDPADLNIHARDARIMDKHAHMLLKCGQDAYKSSKIETSSILPEEIGFFAGMGMVDYNIEDLLPSVIKSLDADGNLDYNKFYSDAYQEIFPLWPLSMLNNISFCQVAINLGVKGDNTVFCPHADSGIHAIIEAVNSVLENKAKVALAGGVSEKVSPMSMARASLVNILNTVDASCSPFDKGRKGTILGEGCGILSLELESSAKNRQAAYSAAITGYGTSCERSGNENCPSPGAISLSMEQAVSRAGLRPLDIDLIIAHGDGTIMGDRNENDAIHEVFIKSADTISVFSSKASLGHLHSGAPAIDVILGTYMIENGIIPPVYSMGTEGGTLQGLVHTEPLKTEIRRVLINAISYEGQCASLIIEAFK